MEMTAGTRRRTIVGVFDGPNQAELALTELKDAGFAPEQVSVIAKDTRETRDMVESTGMGGEGAAAGAVLGGIGGGILGWLVGISALVIPGIGPIVGAGVLASTLVGAGVGVAAGGLVGALAEQGVPEEDARGYEESVRGGRILLAVTTASDQQAREAYRIFEGQGGADVRTYGLGGTEPSLGGTELNLGGEHDDRVITSGELRDDGERRSLR